MSKSAADNFMLSKIVKFSLILICYLTQLTNFIDLILFIEHSWLFSKPTNHNLVTLEELTHQTENKNHSSAANMINHNLSF